MMDTALEDYVTIQIEQKLKVRNSRPSRLCTFKVPNELFRVNEKAYEPEIISIGPNHRRKDDLKPMEEYKFRYLQKLLRRTNEDGAARYVKAMSNLEDQARCCYPEPVSLNKVEFVEMMVLDGCFIIELIRKNAMATLRDVDDPIFQSRMIIPKLKRDMLLLENQLPFGVLSELFQMTLTSDQENDFFQLISEFFFKDLPLPGNCINGHDLSVNNIEHLLGFVHDNWLPKERFLAYKKELDDEIKPIPTPKPKPTPKLSTKKKKKKKPTPKPKPVSKPIPTATELEEAGIWFKTEENFSLFDIEYENGRMLIPTLSIDDDTETILRNLIAYELFSNDAKKPDYVLDYTMFMDCLINSAKDVELLQQHGIIVNWLGDNEAVAKLFNRLGHHVVHYKKSFYSDTLEKVNKHCKKRWNKWMAKLRHDYFNSPWALISFLAAVVLLLLTLFQTVYSILSYY